MLQLAPSVLQTPAPHRVPKPAQPKGATACPRRVGADGRAPLRQRPRCALRLVNPMCGVHWDRSTRTRAPPHSASRLSAVQSIHVGWAATQDVGTPATGSVHGSSCNAQLKSPTARPGLSGCTGHPPRTPAPHARRPHGYRQQAGRTPHTTASMCHPGGTTRHKRRAEDPPQSARANTPSILPAPPIPPGTCHPRPPPTQRTHRGKPCAALPPRPRSPAQADQRMPISQRLIT